MSTDAIPQAYRCPFCACRDLHVVNATFELGHYVACLTCEAQGPIGESPEEALERWENRALYGSIEFY